MLKHNNWLIIRLNNNNQYIYIYLYIYISILYIYHHCLRTISIKNFRGWIAGFNPIYCLIEIRLLEYAGFVAISFYLSFLLSPLVEKTIGYISPNHLLYFICCGFCPSAFSERFPKGTSNRNPFWLSVVAKQNVDKCPTRITVFPSSL